LAVLASLEHRITEFEARLNQNTTNSSKPPSTDPPAVKVKRPLPPGSLWGTLVGHTKGILTYTYR
jgi:transposase